jgi:hypothetical protein
MSRPTRRDPRRNVIKPQMEKLEIRWLMSQAQALAGTRQTRELLEEEIGRIGGGLGRTLAVQLARWESHHQDAANSGAVALESFEARTLKQHDSLGPWGGLRLLVQMELRGDHRFDALYQRLSGRFERWAASHPAQARVLGLNPIPISTPVTSPGTTTTVASVGNATGMTTSGAGLAPTILVGSVHAGPSPDGILPP